MSHDLPRGFLVLPAPEDRTLARLTRKLRLLVLQRLLTTRARTAPLSGALPRVQGWLQGLARDKGRAELLLEALGDPAVMVPLLCLESGQLDAGEAIARAVPSLLARLGREVPQRVSREQLLWDVPLERLDVGEHQLRFAPAALGMLVDGAEVSVRTADGVDHALAERVGAEDAVEALFPLFEGGPALSLCDANPLAMVEDHPDKAGNATDLGGRSVEDWCGALREAFDLIAVALPELHRELTTHLRRLVPVGFEPERHLSASYMEAPSQIYLSLHPSALTLAEALIHEGQHGKLNTLRWFDAVLDNGDETWTESPVRPDLRPLMGVLMGVHAFVPVAALHQRLEALEHPIVATPHFARRRREVLGVNRDGLRTLHALGKPTRAGARVMAALDELHLATGGEPSG
ncbi:MAG: hypothetical protein KC731_00955 [Myxococcales bacterium]|nr:hypothetical protein [Myxococcales bacterium]